MVSPMFCTVRVLRSCVFKFCSTIQSLFNVYIQNLGKLDSKPCQPKLTKSICKIPNPNKSKDHDICILQHNLEEFVALRVLPKLEDEYNYRVYFPARDDIPGINTFTCTAHAIDRSNVVILFVTEEFINQPWFGYITELIILKGVHSVFVALDKTVPFEGLPLNIKWLLKLSKGFVSFSAEEPFEVGTLSCKLQNKRKGDTNPEMEYSLASVSEADDCELFPSSHETTVIQHDICVIHPGVHTTLVDNFIEDLESNSGLFVFSSERDVIPGKYISEHLLSVMYSSKRTVFILNGSENGETTTFLIKIALQRVNIPCTIIYSASFPFPAILQESRSVTNLYQLIEYFGYSILANEVELWICIPKPFPLLRCWFLDF